MSTIISSREDILNTEAGPVMNCWVSSIVLRQGDYVVNRCGPKNDIIQHVIRSPLYGLALPADHSTDISAAWEVHKAACAWLFSRRKHYLNELTWLVCTRKGFGIAWPDILIFLEPVDFCRAALLAVWEEGREYIGEETGNELTLV